MSEKFDLSSISKEDIENLSEQDKALFSKYWYALDKVSKTARFLESNKYSPAEGVEVYECLKYLDSLAGSLISQIEYTITPIKENEDGQEEKSDQEKASAQAGS